MKSNQLCMEEEFHARMKDLKREISSNPILLIITTFYKLKCMRICLACIGYYMYIYNEPLMIVIASVLALVEKPTTTWT